MPSSLRDRASRYQRLYARLPHRRPQALVEYDKIYAACQAANAAGAGREVREHVRVRAEETLERLEADGM
jgi:DNA-binding FadR family transcriptional regulator